jgi:endonuclease G
MLVGLLAFKANAAEQVAPLPPASCMAFLPYGAPTAKQNTTTICRSAYMVNHDPVAKIPVWVAYTIQPATAISCLPRDDAFAPDMSLPKGQRAELVDYQKSGYDQGHLAPNADMSVSAQAAKESFLLSNMSPQLPGVNRGVWKQLESSVRAWTYTTKHPLTVYAGDIWPPANARAIGPNKVVVPDVLWKVVVDNTTKQSLAFMFPNREGLATDIKPFQVSVADIEKATGLVIPVPDNKMIKNPVPIADLNAVTTAKKTACKN